MSAGHPHQVGDDFAAFLDPTMSQAETQVKPQPAGLQRPSVATRRHAGSYDASLSQATPHSTPPRSGAAVNLSQRDQHPLRTGSGSGGDSVLGAAISGSPRAVGAGFTPHTAAGDAPFNFDWDASFDALSNTANFYEPQGELADELNAQQAANKNFSIPQPLLLDQPTEAGNGFGGRYTERNPARNIRPAAGVAKGNSTLGRTGVKRKHDSEPPAGDQVGDPAEWTTSEPGAHVRSHPLPTGRMSGPSSTSTAADGNEYGDADALPSHAHHRTSSTAKQPAAGAATKSSHMPAPPSSAARFTGAAARRRASDGDDNRAGRASESLHAPIHPNIPRVLPHEKVFPIQIGSELFRLSGASISSDAPSYFSQFFERQLRQNGNDGENIRTLYIDRDPITFRDISRHLQGYNVQPKDGTHFVKLFADAQFYNLPRFISQLYEAEIFVQIGHEHFRVPRDLFSGPGDSPNFFSLGFAVFFSTPEKVFPGLNRDGLLRPPSILPPSVPARSAAVFADLLHMLRGYPLHIRDEEHRAELLRDCRYFHLRGLEQRLIPHHIGFNLRRNRTEIMIRLEEIKVSGLSFVTDTLPSERSPSTGWVNYSRPFVDEASYELVLEIGGECTKIDFRSMRADFHGQAKARISSLFQVVANKMNLPTNQPLGLLMISGGAANQPASPGNTPLSEDQVKIRIDRDAHIILDGKEYSGDRSEFGCQEGVEYDDTSGHSSYPGTVAAAEPGFPGTVGASTDSTNETSPTWPQHAFPPFAAIGPGAQAPPRTRKRRGSLDDFGEWLVRKAQWRLRIQSASESSKSGMEVVLMAVKIDAVSGELGRNAQRSFLGP
ncbi:MAG: hypothetical protein M1825_005765 [Sarcosagium campestre]|nr:MAG: hypothetical protein M1825_005765 [Sarcosagium campestre]